MYFLGTKKEVTKYQLQLAKTQSLKNGSITKSPVGLWEPTYDTELWKNNKILNLFVQNVEQGDGETTVDLKGQKANVLQWKIK